MSVCVFGVCSDLGADNYGSACGPKLIVPDAPMLGCSQLDYDYHIKRGEDLGNYPQEFVDVVERLHAAHLSEVAEYTMQILNCENKPLMVGGDHSFSYPILKAILDRSQEPLHLLHFDAHTDDNYRGKCTVTPKHGDFLYYLKRDYPKQLKVTYVSSYPDIYLYGKLAKKPSQIYLKDHERLYISIDVDCLIRSEMVTTGFPRAIDKDGLTCCDIIDYLRELVTRKMVIVGGDVVEFGIQGKVNEDDLGRAKQLVLSLEAALANTPNVGVLE